MAQTKKPSKGVKTLFAEVLYPLKNISLQEMKDEHDKRKASKLAALGK